MPIQLFLTQKDMEFDIDMHYSSTSVKIYPVEILKI
jgi:hypothetical protein